MKSPELTRPPAVLAILAIALSGATAHASTWFAAKATGVPVAITRICAACHGRDGNSPNPNVPSLAGQGAPYLEHQLAAFKAQRRTGVMSGIAVGLSDAAMLASAAWFAQQAAQPNADPWPDSDALRHGAAIYRRGIAKKNIPSCASCHALNASGLPPEFPRLAGQHTNYIKAQLRAFRSDSRLGDSNAMMHRISAKLSDEEIDAVAEYITDLP